MKNLVDFISESKREGKIRIPRKLANYIGDICYILMDYVDGDNLDSQFDTDLTSDDLYDIYDDFYAQIEETTGTPIVVRRSDAKRISDIVALYSSYYWSEEPEERNEDDLYDKYYKNGKYIKYNEQLKKLLGCNII